MSHRQEDVLFRVDQIYRLVVIFALIYLEDIAGETLEFHSFCFCS